MAKIKVGISVGDLNGIGMDFEWNLQRALRNTSDVTFYCSRPAGEYFFTLFTFFYSFYFLLYFLFISTTFPVQDSRLSDVSAAALAMPRGSGDCVGASRSDTRARSPPLEQPCLLPPYQSMYQYEEATRHYSSGKGAIFELALARRHPILHLPNARSARHGRVPAHPLPHHVPC